MPCQGWTEATAFLKRSAKILFNIPLRIRGREAEALTPYVLKRPSALDLLVAASAELDASRRLTTRLLPSSYASTPPVTPGHPSSLHRRPSPGPPPRRHKPPRLVLPAHAASGNILKKSPTTWLGLSAAALLWLPRCLAVFAHNAHN